MSRATDTASSLTNAEMPCDYAHSGDTAHCDTAHGDTAHCDTAHEEQSGNDLLHDEALAVVIANEEAQPAPEATVRPSRKTRTARTAKPAASVLLKLIWWLVLCNTIAINLAVFGPLAFVFFTRGEGTVAQRIGALIFTNNVVHAFGARHGALRMAEKESTFNFVGKDNGSGAPFTGSNDQNSQGYSDIFNGAYQPPFSIGFGKSNNSNSESPSADGSKNVDSILGLGDGSIPLDNEEKQHDQTNQKTDKKDLVIPDTIITPVKIQPSGTDATHKNSEADIELSPRTEPTAQEAADPSTTDIPAASAEKQAVITDGANSTFKSDRLTLSQVDSSEGLGTVKGNPSKVNDSHKVSQDIPKVPDQDLRSNLPIPTVGVEQKETTQEPDSAVDSTELLRLKTLGGGNNDLQKRRVEGQSSDISGTAVNDKDSPRHDKKDKLADDNEQERLSLVNAETDNIETEQSATVEEKKKQDEERQRLDEIERSRHEEERKRMEEERKTQEEQRKQLEKEKRLKQEEEERKQNEEKLRVKQEEERNRREAEERLKQEEDERQRREAEERLKQEEERIGKEEAERLRQEEEKRQRNEEERKRQKDERVRMEEEEKNTHRRMELEKGRRLEEQERMRHEEERKRIEEEERLKQEEEERKRIEEEERLKQEEEERKRNEENDRQMALQKAQEQLPFSIEAFYENSIHTYVAKVIETDDDKTKQITIARRNLEATRQTLHDRLQSLKPEFSSHQNISNLNVMEDMLEGLVSAISTFNTRIDTLSAFDSQLERNKNLVCTIRNSLDKKSNTDLIAVQSILLDLSKVDFKDEFKNINRDVVSQRHEVLTCLMTFEQTANTASESIKLAYIPFLDKLKEATIRLLALQSEIESKFYKSFDTYESEYNMAHQALPSRLEKSNLKK